MESKVPHLNRFREQLDECPDNHTGEQLPRVSDEVANEIDGIRYVAMQLWQERI